MADPILLISGSSQTNSTNFSTASISFNTGDLILAYFYSDFVASGTPAPPSSVNTPSGLTFDQQDFVAGDAAFLSFTLYRGEATANGSGTITFNSPGGASLDVGVWIVLKFTGHVTGANGANAFNTNKQIAGNKGAGATDSATLSALASTQNYALAAFSCEVGIGTTPAAATADNSFTELADQGQGDAVGNFSETVTVMYKVNATNPAVTWTAASPSTRSSMAHEILMLSGPTITAEPTDQTADKGATATFSITATGTAPITYQWQDDSSGSFANISGATSSSYGVAATYAMQGRQYRCVVTDSNGSTTSASAKLTVRSNLVDTGPRVIPVFGAPFGHSIHGWIQGTLSSSGASGTLSVTEGHDTLAASGTTTIVGSLAKTNQNDTVSAAATPIISASLAKTNQNDSLSSAASPVITSTFSRTNANDTLNAAGSVGSSVSGSASVTGGNDTLSASGTTTVNGTFAKTNQNDTLSASAVPTVVGTLAKTGGNDTLSALSTSQVNATVGISENRDTLNAAGNVAIPSTFASTNRNDTLVASGNVTITSTLAVTENHDNLNASGVSGTPPVGGNAFWRFMGLVLGRMRL